MSSEIRIRRASRWPWMTLAVGGLVLIAWQSADLAALLSFDKSAVGTGQLWRIITGHITHWSRSHMTWDLCVFLVLSAVAERISRTKLAAAWLASALAISAWVWFAEPGLASYRGLSGIDSALFVLVSVTVWQRAGPNDVLPRWLAALALVLFLGKLVLELTGAGTMFVADADFVAVPAAHAVGGLVGLLIGIIDPAKFKFLRPSARLVESA